MPSSDGRPKGVPVLGYKLLASLSKHRANFCILVGNCLILVFILARGYNCLASPLEQKEARPQVCSCARLQTSHKCNKLNGQFLYFSWKLSNVKRGDA